MVQQEGTAMLHSQFDLEILNQARQADLQAAAPSRHEMGRHRVRGAGFRRAVGLALMGVGARLANVESPATRHPAPAGRVA